MSKTAILLLLSAWTSLQGGGSTAGPASVRQTSYAVVVNAGNPLKETADATKAIVRRLFLKELSQWPDGTDARPYAREATTAEQLAFLGAVLGMKEAELARHWLRVKNMNGTTPPKEVDTDRMVLKYVAKHAGAFGIVKIAAARDAVGVRVLLEF